MFKKYRHFIVSMLFLAGVINYLDRSALSVAAPLVTKALNLNPAELGLIFSSFFIGYALFNFIGGFLSDIVGPRKIFGASMTFWSIFCGLTAVAFNFVSLFIIRLLFGFGEGPLASTTNKTVTNWVPQDKRARAVGIAFMGTPLGGAISAPIVGFIALYWNWRVSFVVIAIIGLIWTIFWMRFVTDHPRQHRKVSEAEIHEIEQGTSAAPAAATEGTKTSLSYYLKQPTVLFTALAFFAYNYILYFFLTWFPSYLASARHLSITSLSIAATIPWLVGSIGLFLSGWISDYIYQKTNKLMFSRKVVLVGGLLASAVCIALTGLVATAASAVTLMALGIFFMYITGAVYWAIISDNVTGEKVGGASGFVHALSNISGIIAPSLTGFIVQFTGAFTTAFFLAGALALVGAVGVMVFVKPLAMKSEQVGRAIPVLGPSAAARRET